MAQIFIAHWESRNYIYQGFGISPDAAKKIALSGYRKMVKARSGDTLTKDDIRIFMDEVSIDTLQIGKCLVDCGRQGWI